MAKSKQQDHDQAIRKAIALLSSQGRDVTTSAILSTLYTGGIKAKPSDVHASAAWKELVAKEKKAEPPASTTTQEKPVAKAEKKPNFPTKTCPKCGKLIHAAAKKHEACGWVAGEAEGTPPAAAKPSGKKLGRPKKVNAASSSENVSIEDIQAVKKLVDALGAEKVRDLARVLGGRKRSPGRCGRAGAAVKAQVPLICSLGPVPWPPDARNLGTWRFQQSPHPRRRPSIDPPSPQSSCSISRPHRPAP